MLNGKDVRVKVGYPLFAFLSHTKISQGVLDVRADAVPVEFGVALAHISWALVTELGVGADFLELVEQSRDLPEVVRGEPQ